MNDLDDEVIRLARNISENLAGNSFPKSFAKLYSQYTRLRANQESLASWQLADTYSGLNEAIKLLEAAFIQKEIGDDSWHASMRRVGELLEWLSHPALNSENLPIRLMSAAAYQLAGYSARATGILNEESNNSESKILRALLKANFQELLDNLVVYWSNETATQNQTPPNTALEMSKNFQTWIIKEIISSIGILCSDMRWGHEARLIKAIEKFKAIERAFLYTNDSYSLLLVKLCSEVASVYVANSMRKYVAQLSESVDESGKKAFERYVRRNYSDNRTLLWPSQIQGIEQLTTLKSFALCTPTGSGKTTIAELGILQSLFLISNNQAEQRLYEPLVMYLVPSRALAAEVEWKMSRVLRRLADNKKITVTGLYGGTDWGPTDVWLTNNDPTVLICTYEKAEALIRFLGPIFLNRVSLIVLDEAHAVQFNDKTTDLINGESRSLRMELLGTRFLSYLNPNSTRLIALSAVAASSEKALTNWITDDEKTEPIKNSYRSTRQLVGRLECLPKGRFEIRYDLLDGLRVAFNEPGQKDKDEAPYIPKPFPNYPPAPSFNRADKEKALRPYLFWAALHLAALDSTGQQHTVLISVTQNIGGYAEDFLKLLEKDWKNENLPTFFKPPSEGSKKNLWEKCLESCADYFNRTSREYRLLEKGIVLHHGKMPGLLARLLIEVIQERIVYLVIATSTLSEGVNLPFETVLIPTLRRSTKFLSYSEFSNLIGRAGRPGFGTEGRSLVLLSDSTPDNRNEYNKILKTWETENKKIETNQDAHSSLAALLNEIKEQWKSLTNSNNNDEFLAWLEQTRPLDVVPTNDEGNKSLEALDTLDSFLLSIIVEAEQRSQEEINAIELEDLLKKVWAKSYARYATSNEEKLQNYFIHRGQALPTRIYPNSNQRRKFYRTSLSPRFAKDLLNRYNEVISLLKAGNGYVEWSDAQRFEYIEQILRFIGSGSLTKFNFTPKAGRSVVNWQDVLKWWLNPSAIDSIEPSVIQVSDWHNYVSNNFNYKANWALGSIIALAIDEVNDGELTEDNLQSWKQTNLPWIAFWVKELIIWGTLEPVAAYLLARRLVVTRKEAEEAASAYYIDQEEQGVSGDDFLNPTVIKDWVNASFRDEPTPLPYGPPLKIKVTLVRDFSKTSKTFWRVVPVNLGAEIGWFDLAGFQLAKSQLIENWETTYLHIYEFRLDSKEKVVTTNIYSLYEEELEEI